MDSASRRFYPHRSGHGEMRHNSLGPALRVLIPFPIALRFADRGRSVWGLAEPTSESSGVRDTGRRVQTNVPIKFHEVPDAAAVGRQMEDWETDKYHDLGPGGMDDKQRHDLESQC